MKILIVFREGLSGHYLKSLIDDSPGDINFRVDSWYPGIYDLGGVPYRSSDCSCLHLSHIENLDRFMTNFDLILTIQVNKKIYHACYNVFFKKVLVENLDYNEKYKTWKQDLLFWYDVSYYNIKEYHDLFLSDRRHNTISNIIEFDDILDIDYVREIFKKYLHRDLSDNMIRIINTYREKQVQHQLDHKARSMSEIISYLPESVFEESPWFASYCIFKFENSNNLAESQRLWSINDVNRPIDKKFLLSIENLYQS